MKNEMMRLMMADGRVFDEINIITELGGCVNVAERRERGVVNSELKHKDARITPEVGGGVFSRRRQ